MKAQKRICERCGIWQNPPELKSYPVITVSRLDPVWLLYPWPGAPAGPLQTLWDPQKQGPFRHRPCCPAQGERPSLSLHPPQHSLLHCQLCIASPAPDSSPDRASSHTLSTLPEPHAGPLPRHGKPCSLSLLCGSKGTQS